jgi:hypothetical protein
MARIAGIDQAVMDDHPRRMISRAARSVSRSGSPGPAPTRDRIGAIVRRVIGARAVVARQADAAERRASGAVGRAVPVDHPGPDIGPEAVVFLRRFPPTSEADRPKRVRWPRQSPRRNRSTRIIWSIGPNSSTSGRSLIAVVSMIAGDRNGRSSSRADQMLDRLAAVAEQVEEAFGQAIGRLVVDHRAHERRWARRTGRRR